MLSLKLPQLLQVHQVPRVFWEDGIVSGYRRPTSSALDCVLSSFQMTNETVNIWTHFLPTWYFLWRLLVLAGGPGFRAEPYHWPLLVFLLPTCLYPFASCCAHTFSSMSPRARHICYFLDYGALSLYSLGHSHQLFHICAVLGTHFQLEAVLADMESRQAWLATQATPLGLAGTVATLGLAVAGNLLIIAAFTASLFRAPSTCPLLQGGPPEGGTNAKQQ
uniref:Progestin and adipoQ receptor family member 6 n=1 Tax=Myotis myotis TaxID=51298 RepID=A0A7J7SSE9_MYOMY|nr:progestin and adipoQ receptor family member 6 [Myotis myotis]